MDMLEISQYFTFSTCEIEDVWDFYLWVLNLIIGEPKIQKKTKFKKKKRHFSAVK